MTLCRAIALAMLLLECFVMWQMFNAWVFPLIAGVLAVTAAATNFRLNLSREQKVMLALVAGVAVAIEWRLLLLGDPSPSVVWSDGLGYGLAQYAVILQLGQYVLRREASPGPIFPFLGAFALTCCGDVQHLSGPYHEVFRAAALAYIVLYALYLLQGRPALPGPSYRRRSVPLITAILAAVVVLAATVATTLYRYRVELDNAFIQMVPGLMEPTDAGFPSNARLNNLTGYKHTKGRKTALRVFASHAPGYMRGRAYGECLGANWRAGVPAHDATPVAERPDLGTRWSNTPVFPLVPAPRLDGPRLEVWPAILTRGALFTTLDAQWIATDAEKVAVDALANADTSRYAPRTPYVLGRSAPLRPAAEPVGLTPQERAALTAVPEDLDPRVRELARTVCRDAHTTTEKVGAVIDYFRENYTYKLGIQLPRGQDPLAWFLLERPPAHCEYFASGAAVLLRLNGVPCRYVTGFVVSEHNSLGGYWFARNRDAHAWVEAYDDSQGWVLVEATVAEGVPEQAPDENGNSVSELWDYLKFRLQDLKAAFAAGGWRNLLRRIGGLLLAVAGRLLVPAIVTVAIAAALLFVLRLRRRARSRAHRPAVSPEAVALRALLARMDKRLRRQGFTRAPSETLHAFAGRIAEEKPGDPAAQEAADWYRAYARVRYDVPAPERIAHLQKGLTSE